MYSMDSLLKISAFFVIPVSLRIATPLGYWGTSYVYTVVTINFWGLTDWRERFSLSMVDCPWGHCTRATTATHVAVFTCVRCVSTMLRGIRVYWFVYIIGTYVSLYCFWFVLSCNAQLCVIPQNAARTLLDVCFRDSNVSIKKYYLLYTRRNDLFGGCQPDIWRQTFARTFFSFVLINTCRFVCLRTFGFFSFCSLQAFHQTLAMVRAQIIA